MKIYLKYHRIFPSKKYKGNTQTAVAFEKFKIDEKGKIINGTFLKKNNTIEK